MSGEFEFNELFSSSPCFPTPLADFGDDDYDDECFSLDGADRSSVLPGRSSVVAKIERISLSNCIDFVERPVIHPKCSEAIIRDGADVHSISDSTPPDDQEWDDDEDDEEEEEDEESGSETLVGPPEVVSLSTHIDLSSFEILKVVGKGGFGKVHQVKMKSTGEIFAMKALKKRYLIKAKCVENTKAERDILKKIKHPYIVGLHYAFQTNQRLYLIMDFVNGGQLLYHLKREAMFSEDQARFYLAELVLALEHLHSQDIVHRDLKPENILLDSEGHCVLTDFGFAKEMMSSDHSGADSFVGTLEYMAPEMVAGKGYGKAADWWSLGVLVYDMLVGHPPFQHKSDQTLQQKILKEKIHLPKYLSPPAVSLIKALVERNLDKRLGTGPKGVAAIKAHPFFRKINWKKMMAREIAPPFRPPVANGKLDVSQFDDEFLRMSIADSPGSPPLSASLQDWFKGFSYVRSPTMPTIVL